MQPRASQLVTFFQDLRESVGLGWRAQLAVFAVALLAFLARRPDALLHARFYGEDGTIWYSDAYNLGWLRALLIPHTGYFQTLPRLAAALSLLVPLRFAPLVTNAVGLVIQVLPVTFLLSPRSRNWGPLSLRALFALAYVLLPNSYELDATITEGQWHLALLACLVVLSSPAATIGWQVFDIAVLLLNGLTGPFCLVLFAVAILFAVLRRSAWRWVQAGVIAIGVAVESFALLRTAVETRSPTMLGATPKLFLVLLSGRVYLAMLAGNLSLQAQQHLSVLIIAFLPCTLLLAYCLWKGSLELRLFLLFTGALFAASLRNPMVSVTTPQWQVLATLPGARYWFLPTLALMWAAIWCWRAAGSSGMRMLAGCMLVVSCIGVTEDWTYPPYANVGFVRGAQAFSAATPGTLITIPIDPPGWSMQLRKQVPNCPAMPMGFIDSPAPNARLSDPVRISGWTSASAVPIESVSILIDNRLAAATKPSIVRPDVNAAHPELPDRNKGWEASVGTSQLSAGPHEIEVWAQERSGCKAEIGVVRVER